MSHPEVIQAFPWFVILFLTELQSDKIVEIQ